MDIKIKDARYMGSLSANSPDGLVFARSEAESTSIHLTDFGIRWSGGRIGWSKINTLDIDGSTEVRRRVTVTRLVAIGIFAFAAKKRVEDATSYLVASTDEGEAIFEIDGISPIDLRVRLKEAIDVWETYGTLRDWDPLGDLRDP